MIPTAMMTFRTSEGRGRDRALFPAAAKLTLSSSQEVGRMKERDHAKSFATLAIAEDARLFILPATSEVGFKQRHLRGR
jgi:hypothetical protein